MLDDLEMSGCSIDTPKRPSLLNLTLNGFGVKRQGNHLEVNASPDNFPLQKHNLLQAMLAANDLFCLATPVVAGLFFEDVESWLNQYAIRYTPNIKLSGKSGYDYVFNFVIPSSTEQPERIVNAINQPNRQTVLSFVFAWLDTRENRPHDSRAIAILNDDNRSIGPGVMEALTGYDVRPIPWSQPKYAVEELAA